MTTYAWMPLTDGGMEYPLRSGTTDAIHHKRSVQLHCVVAGNPATPVILMRTHLGA